MQKTGNETIIYYNEKAEKWAKKHTDSFAHEEQFRKFITHLRPGDEVLDIGCSHGIDIPLFFGIGRGLGYVGLDASACLLQIAKSRYPQLQFIQADIATGANLPAKRFAGFWASAILMHIPLEQWTMMLMNIKSIMKKGATGYIMLPTERPNAETGEDPRHFTLLPDEEFKKTMAVRNWTILESGDFRTSIKWRWYIVQLP